MQRKLRLTRPQDFSSVYRKGTSRSSNLLVLRASPNGLSVSRFGFSVSKRVGGAVVRNTMKRRLREILRITPVRSAWDIVIIVRPPAASADFSTLKQTVQTLLSRCNLLQKTNPDSGTQIPANLK
jgi:ribonuclease P protein component